MIGAGAIVAGVVLRKIAQSSERKRRGGEVVLMTKQDDGLESIRLLHFEYPNIIPGAPRSVSALEFQGWFKEASRQLEIWAIGHRSAADMALRIQLQKQINDLEEEWLRNQRTRSEIDLVKHRHAAEIAKLKRDAAQADDETEQIRERAAQRKNPSSPAPASKRESLGERLARVDRECEEEATKYPEQKEFLERARDDRKMKIMEGRE
jgi:hypothetical protein